MNDTLLFIVVITGALVLILGTAYAMDQRRKSTGKSATKVPAGPLSRIVLWASYIILAITILFIIGSFTFNEIAFATLAWDSIFLYIIAAIIYRIVRPRGM